MFYKLKTDLPTFKAGDLFYLDQDGSLRYKDNPEIIAYHHITLEKFPDALEKFWDPVEEEFKRWRAEEDRKFFFVSYSGQAIRALDLRDLFSSGCYELGNYFKTEGEAQAVADYLKALAIVRDDAKGFNPDWADRSQEKWLVMVLYSSDESIEKLKPAYAYTQNLSGIFGLPYFKTEDDARASIEKHKAEWLTIFGVKDEMESDDE